MQEGIVVTIDVASDVESFLQEQVRADVCSDPSELVSDVIRSLREQQRKPFEVTSELEGMVFGQRWLGCGGAVS